MENSNEIQEKLKSAKFKMKLLTIMVISMAAISVALVYLWQQAANKYELGKNTIFTEPIERPKADQLVKDYRNATYFPDLDKKEGIKHDVKKLIEIFTYWHSSLSVDSVDFRFGLQDAGSKYPDMINIIIYPQSHKSDITAIPSDKRTWPVDLGDLHP